jgi:CDP-diacylglycerol--glycerol-3-phosphate 3-phosphatidyltransferase
MPITTPTLLTLVRIGLIPVFVIAYYLPFSWANAVATALFILAGVTDWLDGYLARRLNQQSEFGAFLDPVADKLMVTTALVLLVSDDMIQAAVINQVVFTVVVAIIIGREIGVSALREWMAELGKRASVAVSLMGKFKTMAQIVAISMLIYQAPVFGISMALLGEILLYVAAALTIWSMFVYLRAAWDSLGVGIASKSQVISGDINDDLTG